MSHMLLQMQDAMTSFGDVSAPSLGLQLEDSVKAPIAAPSSVYLPPSMDGHWQAPTHVVSVMNSNQMPWGQVSRVDHTTGVAGSDGLMVHWIVCD
jgi:hypothetical protein